MEKVKDGSQDGHVTEDIIQTGGGRAVEAVSGNGIANLLHGVVRDLELVAIGIEHLAARLLRGH